MIFNLELFLYTTYINTDKHKIIARKHEIFFFFLFETKALRFWYNNYNILHEFFLSWDDCFRIILSKGVEPMEEDLEAVVEAAFESVAFAVVDKDVACVNLTN